MFTSLRARLLASYILVIVLSLTVIGITLIFVLRSQPVLTEATSLRLYNLLQQIDTVQEQQDTTIPENGPTLAQRRGLNNLDKSLQIRILLANSDGLVTFDSRRQYRYGSQLDIEAKAYTPPTAVQGDKEFATVRGILHNPDGTDWLFVSQAPDATNPQKQLFMIAIRAPRLLTPTETLEYYGPGLTAPLVEAGLAGLLVAAVLSLIIARSVARPLQDVAKAAAAVAEGRLDHRAPVRGPREVKTLAETFNQMAQQVGATQQAQRDFLANVTHDLRTPLTSIQGFSQAIMEGVTSDPGAAQRAAQIIHDEAGRLNRMVQELLDLARIEAGRLNMTRHSVRLTEILQAVGERVAPSAADKGLTLSTEVPALPPIAGDGDRLVQVYTNLIDNAIKHTPHGGKITLRAGTQDGGVLVQVCDTGEGIPTDDLPHIFDRFYQVDKSRQRAKRDGAGLGLTIAKGIVDAHGGRLWAESQEGVGTTFSTWFPALASDSTTIIARRRSGLFKTPAPKPDRVPSDR
jgi:two-component system, OmpR family, sensor kinase